MKLVKLGTYYKSMVFYNKLFSRPIEIQSVVSLSHTTEKRWKKHLAVLRLSTIECYSLLLIPARPVNALPSKFLHR